MNEEAHLLNEAIKLAKQNGFELIAHKHFCETANDELTGIVVGIGAYESIIFDIDFAQAVFGNRPVCDICGSWEFDGGTTPTDYGDEHWAACKRCGREPVDILEFGIADGTTYPAWAYHLREMSITHRDQRIKYLWENRRKD